MQKLYHAAFAYYSILGARSEHALSKMNKCEKEKKALISNHLASVSLVFFTSNINLPGN